MRIEILLKVEVSSCYRQVFISMYIGRYLKYIPLCIV